MRAGHLRGHWLSHVVSVVFLLFLGVFLRRDVARRSAIRVGTADHTQRRNRPAKEMMRGCGRRLSRVMRRAAWRVFHLAERFIQLAR
jgi:hypothetical protein